MEQNDGFTYQRNGSVGCEIRCPGGFVVAWACSELWAQYLVYVLNLHDSRHPHQCGEGGCGHENVTP